MSKTNKRIVEKYFLATRTFYPAYAPHALSISTHMDRSPSSFHSSMATRLLPLSC